jgi:WD40 repeat protein
LSIGIYLLSKAREADNKNGISALPLRNIFLPWPKAAIGAAIFVLVELIVLIPIYAYHLYPCSIVDVVRKINGCNAHIQQTGMVQDIAFSKDGKIFATSEFRGPVQIWSYPDLTLLKNLGNDWIFDTKLSLSSNGEMLAVCGYRGPTSILETRTGKVLYNLQPASEASCNIAFTQNDRHVVSISSESGLQLWEVSSRKLLYSIPLEHPISAISNDSTLLASGGYTGPIEIRNIADNEVLATIQHHGLIKAMTFSLNGELLLIATTNILDYGNDSFKTKTSTIYVWNLKNEHLENTTTLQNIWIDNIINLQHGNLAIVASDLCSRNYIVDVNNACTYLIQTTDGKPVTNLLIPYGTDSAAFSPSDDKILIGSYKNLYIWQKP